MELIQDYIKVCPVCEEEYEANRLNQTYCSTQCKARFNNNKARKNKLSYSSVTEKKNKVLWKNREILSDHQDSTVEVKFLEKVGFKLNYVTNFFLDKKLNQNVLVVYDYAYYFITEKKIKIKRYE